MQTLDGIGEDLCVLEHLGRRFLDDRELPVVVIELWICGLCARDQVGNSG